MGRKKTKRCTACRKWYSPEPQVGQRQKTCSKVCGKERHRKKCAQWNRANKHLNKGAQLKRRLDKAKKTAESPMGMASTGKSLSTRKRRLSGPRRLDIPKQEIQDEIGLGATVIIEFIVQILDKAFVRRVDHAKLLNPAYYGKKDGQKVSYGARADGS